MVTALSNEEFGQRVGVSTSVASRIRTGRHRPTLKVLAAISAEFRIPINDLVLACLEGGRGQAEILALAIPRLSEKASA